MLDCDARGDVVGIDIDIDIDNASRRVDLSVLALSRLPENRNHRRLTPRRRLAGAALSSLIRIRLAFRHLRAAVAGSRLHCERAKRVHARFATVRFTSGFARHITKNGVTGRRRRLARLVLSAN